MNKGVAVAVADDPTQLASRVDLLDIRSEQTPPSVEGGSSRRPLEEGRRS
jgi:hypothetical protein